MDLRYELIELEEAHNKGIIDWKPGCGYGYGIFRVENGNYTLIGTDCGEPEDKSFHRDFDWIVGELHYAMNYVKEALTPKPEVEKPADEIQADIRKRAGEFLSRRDGATTPEVRAKYKQLLKQVRAECKHPGLISDEAGSACPDCFSIFGD